jgi:hypothetical protein
MTTQRQRRKQRKNEAPLVIEIQPPRNQVIRALMQRGAGGAGTHEKSAKAKRRAEKVSIAKEHH